MRIPDSPAAVILISAERLNEGGNKATEIVVFGKASEILVEISPKTCLMRIDNVFLRG